MVDNMKCLYCNKEVDGNYCSECGKKVVTEFSVSNFGEVQEYVYNNQKKYLSQEFLNEIELGYTGDSMTMRKLYKSFRLFGYLFRATEGKFGSLSLMDGEIEKVLKDNTKDKGQRLKEATNLLDQGLDIDSISIDGLQKDYLIVKEIPPIFEGYIDNNVNNVANQIMNEGGQGAIDIDYLQNNFDKFRELLFRNATWGYLYRVVEEQSK